MTAASIVGRILATASLSLIGGGAMADTQRGVTDTEILVGTITDLSGVTAVQGVNNANAVRLAFDEVNEKGGINGPRYATSWRTASTRCRARYRRSTS
jgi:branched-chain amino acid transport system substrate-binding protein